MEEDFWGFRRNLAGFRPSKKLKNARNVGFLLATCSEEELLFPVSPQTHSWGEYFFSGRASKSAYFQVFFESGWFFEDRGETAKAIPARNAISSKVRTLEKMAFRDQNEELFFPVSPQNHSWGDEFFSGRGSKSGFVSSIAWRRIFGDFAGILQVSDLRKN